MLWDEGVTVALATDCNPGTSFVERMPFVVALGVLELGLSPEEALWAATRGGSLALELPDRGRLGPEPWPTWSCSMRTPTSISPTVQMRTTRGRWSSEVWSSPVETRSLRPFERGALMDVDELLAKANDSISVSRAYGPPIESGGAIIIPAARAAGGAGGGSGTTRAAARDPAGAMG